MNTEPITISFLGVDERSKSAYRLFFENITPVQYELIDDCQQAQLCLIDKDSYNVQQQYDDLTKNYPEKYILVLSIIDHACTHDREFFLQKPIKREALQELLNKISGYISGKTILPSSAPSRSQIKNTVRKISEKYRKKSDVEKLDEPVKPVIKEKDSTVVPINKKPKAATASAGKLLKIKNEGYFVGEHPDVDINDPEQLKEVFYSPEKFLQGIMEQARKKSQQSGQIVQLNAMDHIFYFDDKNQKVHSTVSSSVIRHLCVVNQDEPATYSVKPDSFRDDLAFILQARNKNKINGKHSWSMEAFMWVITLWCSRGRIPAGTDLTRPVYLMQWPNLTRLEQIPHAARISALIYDQPRTLTDTARQLGIRQRYVFAFFSACKAIGLSDVSVRDIDRLFESEKPKHNKNKSILSKILGKLASSQDGNATKKVANTAEV